jgi:nucleoside-diphosphate-sugar epimerase
MSTKHVLLGAGGSIATQLASVLIAQGQTVRLVSRGGHAMTGAESVRADLLDAAATKQAVEDDASVYLLAGLQYRAAVWADQWPTVMRNVIEACAVRRARLVFFDNVYMYGRVDGPMTEDTPINPCSRKGEVRARIAADLMAAVKAGRLEGCIARSADFYGPDCANSLPHLLVFSRLARGGRAQWLADAGLPHSFTYTPDCGRALPLLAAADDASGQVWHLPTAAPALTGTEFVAQAARAFDVRARLTVLRPWMVRLAGFLDRTTAEIVEMLYQNDRPYRFDSSKFERRFNVRPTPYAQGVIETARSYQRGN